MRIIARILVIILGVLLTSTHTHAANVANSMRMLSVNVPLLERMQPSSSSVSSFTWLYQDYELIGLQPNSYYEARVSYIGTIPYACKVEWLESSSSPSNASPSRHLLDVEKLMFSTESIPPSNARIRVTWMWNGVMDANNHDSQPLMYSIVLEQLYAPGIPLSAIKVGILLLLIMLITYQCLFPRIRTWIQEQRIGLQHQHSRQL